MKVRQTAAEDDCNIIQPREPDGAVDVSSRDLAVENVCKGANEVGELLELDILPLICGIKGVSPAMAIAKSSSCRMMWQYDRGVPRRWKYTG